MSDTKFSTLELLDLPQSERMVFLHLSRRGSANEDILAEALDQDSTTIHDALVGLLSKGRVRHLGDGRYEIALGHVTRRTTLPPQFWPAILAADRLYSEQEIATLQTVIPMLQFARAKLSEFNDHGPGHALRVKSFATQLSYIQGLTSTERHLLRAGALFHDIGNVVSRERHNIISQETVLKLTADGDLPFTRKEAEIVGLLCRWHRHEFDPNRVDQLYKEEIRTGLLASILRVADAMDIDHRRSDYDEKFWKVLRFFFADSLHHWTSLEQILGVRICCTPTVNLQVFTKKRGPENVQIDMLCEDLESTPLKWAVIEIDVESPTKYQAVSPLDETQEDKGGNALVVFPFEAHSLVMAALSRYHLIAAGFSIESLCYPDTTSGPAWLWQEALGDIDAKDFNRLVVIGDRPDPNITPIMLQTVAKWQAANVAVSILNRHEANWSRLPQLLDLGIEVILGGDWAYFWGDTVSEADLKWGRIAALCTRDPAQSTVGVTSEERSVTQGLLRVVYDAMVEPPIEDITSSWTEMAEPILRRIAANDQSYFTNRAAEFADIYTKPGTSGRVDGRVVVFDKAPTRIPQAFYWQMEAAINDLGRIPERGIRYNVPYAIAIWRDEDEIEMLAINHWREEEAIPIRLLYPTKIGPPPQGNESTIRVRLSVDVMDDVFRSLLDHCNQS